MIKLLEEAFAEASKLPEPEQHALAAWLLEELASERRWQESFGGSADALANLADEALAEHHDHRTQVLDPDTL
jgi:hypothetical protein